MILNWFSFVFIAIGILVVVGGGLWRLPFGTRWFKLAVWLLLAIGFGGGWWVLRPAPAEREITLAEFEAAVGGGRPVVLAVYSEY